MSALRERLLRQPLPWHCYYYRNRHRKSTSTSKINILGGTGPSGRPLAITVRFLSKRRSFSANFEPTRSNGSHKSINNGTTDHYKS
eukprot:16446426-Heterocapsa_arctica.AAC.1